LYSWEEIVTQLGITQSELTEFALEEGLISEDGNPTQFALDEGLLVRADQENLKVVYKKDEASNHDD